MKISEVLKVRKRGEGVGFVIPTLEEQVLLDSIPDNAKRRNDVFHPSQICRNDFCPREWLLQQRDPSLNGKSVTVQQQLRFDVGKILHSYIQEKLGNAGVLFGTWKCTRLCEGKECNTIGFKPKGVCKKERWVYKEPTVVDERLNIVGNTDGIIVVQGNKYTLEFKSMNTDAFSTLIDAVISDREQSCWYLDILEREQFAEWNHTKDLYEDSKHIMDMPYKGSVLLYMNKNDQLLKEFLTGSLQLKAKEILVKKDQPLVDVMNKKKEILISTMNHLKKGTLCDRLFVCDSLTARRAKSCRAKTPCFKGE